MKSNALTAAAVVFILGLIASGFGITDMFSPRNSKNTVSDLQRGAIVSEFR